MLTELQNIALYCCNGLTESPNCILNRKLNHNNI
jgi:hypothetical protein